MTKYPDSNPKSQFGIKKASFHCIPTAGLIELGAAMEFGAYDAGGTWSEDSTTYLGGPGYGPFNWRGNSVAASVYMDAGMRHRLAWWDSLQEYAPDSMVHHLGHSMACDAIILDAIYNGCLKDDRPVAGQAVDLMKQIEGRKKAYRERIENASKKTRK